MNSEHHPSPSSFKLFLKLGISCFVISILIFSGLKFFGTKATAKPQIAEKATIIKTEDAVQEKSLQDFEKSEMIKKVFENKPPELVIPSVTELETTPTVAPETGNLTTISAEPSSIPTPVIAAENLTYSFDNNKNYQKTIADFINNLKIPNLDAEELATIIITESQAKNFNPLLTTGIIRLESNFNRYAESSDGAVGLMHIFPEDAKRITTKIDLPFLGNISLYHPIYNVRLGLNLLEEYQKATGTWEGAISKYARQENPEAAVKYFQEVVKISKDLDL